MISSVAPKHYDYLVTLDNGRYRLFDTTGTINILTGQNQSNIVYFLVLNGSYIGLQRVNINDYFTI